ncbi:glypican-5 isoform X2 [Electrophorus electricus]|uniref:glypican-5 isoform X2 n=1 Tax=Electrophorus electricus TaxID=8005 RepID=UPI0015D0A681|nr:glypican-5 isoform X2 [Electrophorus electricus]
MSTELFPRVNFWWITVAVASLAAVSEVRCHSCHEVKTAFQLRQIGPLKWVPEAPGTDADLSVCKHAGPSCCTRRMEDSYRTAAVRDLGHGVRTYSFELKYLLSEHATVFKDTYESLLSFSQGHVMSLFESTYTPLAPSIAPHVSALFSDLSIFIHDAANVSVETAVHRFYDHLFPLVYMRLINPGAAGGDLADCLRMTRQDVNPFGRHADTAAHELADALRAGRALTRAFVAGNHAVNSTEAVMLSRECSRALVRMLYCPHCRGLTLIRPCTPYCLNVMRGCLASLTEMDAPWRRYMAILEDLTHTVSAEHSLELNLLRVRGWVNDAILHAQLHGPRLTATVDKLCGKSMTESHSDQPTIPMVTDIPPQMTSQSASLSREKVIRMSSRSLPLKPTKSNKDRSLKQIAREVIMYIRHYISFFNILPESLCEGEMGLDEFTCWSGDDVVERTSIPANVKVERSNEERLARLDFVADVWSGIRRYPL